MRKIYEKLMLLARTITQTDYRIRSIQVQLDELKVLCGSMHAAINKMAVNADINQYEFKVFSQFGDDGIIQHLLNNIPIKNKTFIEFGVEDFFESNTRFLMMNNNWEGFVLDGNDENVDRIVNSSFYWKYQLKAESAFITKENINQLLDKSGFDHDLGLMHIDLDGNDFWIWNEIEKFLPRILILEYNAVLGLKHHWSVPYQANFQRFNSHYSGLYWGASLPAIVTLSDTKGYDLVGCNLSGNNAYFVRKDVNIMPKQDLIAASKVSKYRESRDKAGNFTYISDLQRLDVINGLPIFDTLNNKLETIA